MTHTVRMMRRLGAALCLGLFVAQASAEVAPLTVGAVSQGLQDAVAGFNLAIQAAGAEARSSGASMAGNAQNVITDIDRQLGNRLNTSIDQLSGIERRLADDAVLLTRQVRAAGVALAGATGDEARRTIAEADITAYHASYSLPCRSLVPRIVYSWPRDIRRATGPAEIHLKGNFLDIGTAPKVTVDDEVAEVLGRTRNELTVKIPGKVMAALTDARSVRVAAYLNENRRKNYLVYCHEKIAPLPVALAAAQLLRPELSFKVNIKVGGTFDALEPVSTTTRYNRIDNNHEASFDDNHQICLPADYVLNPAAPPVLTIESLNCNSSVGTPTIAGERCVVVPAHLGGCGVRRALGVVVDHRGRGWFAYNVQLNGLKKVPGTINEQQFELDSPDGVQRSFSVVHPDASKQLLNARWQYAATVHVNEGSKLVRAIMAGSGNPNPEGVTTRMQDGVAYVEVSDAL